MSWTRIGILVAVLQAGFYAAGAEIGHHFNPPWSEAQTARLLEQLQDCRPHERAVAAGRLGCCLYTNPDCHPEVVTALVTSLQCDGAYEVRVKAAWAIAFQKITNRCGWTSLYVSSQLDPHWLVRDTSANALKVIETQLEPETIRAWKTRGDGLVRQFRGNYKPGKPGCTLIY
jgi:hypothetical protein